jgi:uncharacterized protein (TIGR00730 family)
VKRICVFCGSSHGARPEYLDAARQTGLAMVERGLGLVYGAGNVGLMSEIADTILAIGAEAIGVIPEALMAKELAHPRLPEEVIPSGPSASELFPPGKRRFCVAGS